MRVSFSIILILIVTGLFGQVTTEAIDFQKLTGIDSILVTNEGGNLKSVYNYKNNSLIKERQFDEGELVQMIKYWLVGDIEIIQSHMKWTVFPEDGEPYDAWGDTYRVEVIKTQNNKLIEKAYYESTGKDSTLEEKVIPTYDVKGRLVQENVYDYSTGIRNVFKSNSNEFGKGNVKPETTEKIKKYKYEVNKLTIEYLINNKITGREVVELNRKGKASRILTLDHGSNKLGEILLKYDSKDRLIERKWAWYIGQDPWGNTVDFTVPSTQKIFYDSKGLATGIVTMSNGENTDTTYYNYY